MDQLCISHIIANLLLQLCLSSLRINGFPCLLHNVRSSVKFGAVTSCPETVKGNTISYKLIRNHGKAKTNSCKACILGKAAKLNGTGSCTLTLINAVRHIVLGNIRLVSSIIDDHAAVFVCIIHPFLQLIPCDGRACRIVREAKIDQIRHFLWKLR